MTALTSRAISEIPYQRSEIFHIRIQVPHRDTGTTWAIDIMGHTSAGLGPSFFFYLHERVGKSWGLKIGCQTDSD